MENTPPLDKDVVIYKDKLMQMCQIFNRPPPQFETVEKEGKLYSKVCVGTLAVFDQKSPGSATLAESQGKAAFTWLTTFPNTWMESATAKTGPDRAITVLDYARPTVELPEKKPLPGVVGSCGDSQNGTTCSSSLKLKPLSMLVQKEVKEVQPGVTEVAGQVVTGPDTSKVGESPSSWAVVKRDDFLKSNYTEKSFWGSSFVLLVISGVEIRSLAIWKAARMLGVNVRELEREVNQIKRQEKKCVQGGLLSKYALSKIKSEACTRDLGGYADRVGVNKRGQTEDSDESDNIEKRGVKRKGSSSETWITAEVLVHLLRRSFLMKDQVFSLDGGRPPVFVLSRSWPFYESNVTRVVKEIDEYCGFPELLMESCEVQELLRAARNLDSQKMEGGGYALAPSYNYSRCMLEQKANYWETGLPALLLQDVDSGMISAEVAACQLGVIPTMVLAAIAGLKSQDKFSSLWEVHSREKGCDSPEYSDDEGNYDDENDDNWNPKEKESKKRTTRVDVKGQKLSGPVTVKRYKEFGFGSEEDFWKENTTKDVLEKVREREISVEMMAAEWGVSRAEIVRRCGAVKTNQELEDERKLRQLEKFEEKVQNAGFVKKESHLEKQIAKAESCLEQLSAYEKMRLENMRERQALLEELDFDKERKEIAEERQKSMIFTPKEGVGRRAPSARVKALKEQSIRIREEQMRVEYQSIAKQMSPKWVGRWLSFKYSGPQELRMKCMVPRGMLKFGEIEEQHRRLHINQAKRESIAAELSEIVEEPPYTSCGALLSDLEMENESVVSNSAITSMGNFWDFFGFGTAEGGVGVHIGATNNSWRPHNGEVTGIAFYGGASSLGILSTSLDGAVRRSDLARQSVLLEYKEDEEGIGCLVKRNQSEFLLGCDSTVRLLDLRRKRVSSLLSQGGSKMSLHPTDPHMLTVGERIYDLRQPKNALLELQSQISSIQWSPSSGAHLLAVGKFSQQGELCQANVYSTEQLLRGEDGLLFSNRITEPFAAQWSPWSEASLLLPIKLGTCGLQVPMVTAVDLDGKEIGRLMLKSCTVGFLLCCHPSKPRLIVGNSGQRGEVASYKNPNS